MGLAASQARLLSITSRISDNELRAQLINNQKMRLATESSQVSENYISALNKSKLVFANYDKDDNAQNVPLTFNNLTAFNQYNNQYGLTNAAGNILISETEAKLYQASVGAIDPAAEFLRQHGIEETTSYWDKIADQLADTDLQYTKEDLKEMYEGVKDPDTGATIVPSYDETINTKEYNDFAKYADEFEMAIAEVSGQEAERAELQTRFINQLLNGASYGIGDLGNSGTISTIANNIASNLNGVDVSAITTTLNNELKADKFEAAYPDLKDLKNNNTDYYILERGDAPYTPNSMTIDSEGTTLTMGIGNNATATDAGGDSTGVTIIGDTGAFSDPREFTVRFTEDGVTEDVGYYFDITGSTAAVYIKLTPDELKEYVTEFISDVIMNVINDQINNNSATINTSGPVATATDSSGNKIFTAEELTTLGSGTNVASLSDVVNNLATVLFGGNKANHANYSDPYQLLAILNYLTSGTVEWGEGGTGYKTIKDKDGNEIKDIKGNTVSFDWSDLAISENVFNAYVVDTMMDIFGEPVYGYLYTDGNGNVQAKNGNIDASAEAEWYLNLFNKIQSSGYQVLANGLASSTDWLQFALENGIVVMEQINGEGEWQGITYTSCSDISEQTDETAAALAEAEYNQAMRQIEAKDEMYDMELKNIDTEHSSLQAEYESVKKAMSGNIERNFQMYS